MNTSRQHPPLQHSTDSTENDVRAFIKHHKEHKSMVLPVYADPQFCLSFRMLPVKSRFWFLQSTNPNVIVCELSGCREIETDRHLFLGCTRATELCRTIWNDWKRFSSSQFSWKTIAPPHTSQLLPDWNELASQIDVLWNVTRCITAHYLWTTRNKFHFEGNPVPPRATAVATIYAIFSAHYRSLLRQHTVDEQQDFNRVLTVLQGSPSFGRFYQANPAHFQIRRIQLCLSQTGTVTFQIKSNPLAFDVETKIREIQSATPDEIETVRANIERSGHPSLYRFAKSMAELLVAAYTAKASIRWWSFDQPPSALHGKILCSDGWATPYPRLPVRRHVQGFVSVLPGDPQTVLNVVPVDMAANSLLTAAGFKMIESSNHQQKPRIMHCRTSDPRQSPVQLGYLLGEAAKYYLKNSPSKALAPCKMHATPSSMRFHTHWHLKHALPSYLYATMATCTRNPQHEMQAMGFSKVSRQARRMINSHRPFTENDWVFRANALHDQIDALDEWWHSAGGIAWDDCINNHCDGLQQFAISDKPQKSKL